MASLTPRSFATAMRMNLKVPFAEKDEAKKLGARWDAARKIWYVVGDGDMGAFARWSPSAHDGADVTAAPARKAAPATKVQEAGKVVVGSLYVSRVAVCGCPPWDTCEKCASMALPA